MRDELFNRPDNLNDLLALTSADDGTGRLEPLAVPFGRMSSIIRRHLGAILLILTVGVGGSGLVVKTMAKRYTAEASILVEPQRTQVSDLQAISADPGDIGSVVRTQIDILKSPTLAASVVKALKLTQNPEFAPTESRLMVEAEAILSRVGLTSEVTVREPVYEDKVDAAASLLSGKIGFANEPRSGVLRLAVTTQDPEVSANIANEIARQFLDFKRQAKFTAMQRAHDWFQEQMGKLATQLAEADRAVEQYRREFRLDEESPNDGDVRMRTPTINRQQLESVNRLLADVSREQTQKEGQLKQAQLALHGQIPLQALPEVLNSPVIGQLLAATNVLAGRQAQMMTSQGSGNPDLIAVQAQLRKLQATTNQEMTNIAASLTSELKAIGSQEEALKGRLEVLRAAVSGENSAQVGLRALQTKARATRGIYESFLTRATQLANVAGIQEQDASLVSSARPPLAASAPQGSRIVMLAAGLSFVFGIVVACLLERVRSGFSLPEQLEATLGLPLIGLAPSVSRRALRGMRRGRPAIAFSAALEKLRGQLRVLGNTRPKVVLVTSALPKEGKSVLAAGLARNAAAAGWKVLLVECDFGCPSLGAEFGLSPQAGLSEILSGSASADAKKMIHEPEPRLHLILAGQRKGNSQEILASAAMTELLKTVRSEYDLVVLDGPPVLPVADSLMLARQAEATLLVVRWEKTARNAAQDAVRLLNGSRARIIGTVMTRVDRRAAAMAGGRMAYAFRAYDAFYLSHP